MTTYLKFKGDLQAIVKLETGKVTNYFLDLKTALKTESQNDVRNHVKRDHKKTNLQATIVRGIGIRFATNLVRAVKTSAWITAGFRRMRKQQSSLEGNSSIEEKRFSVPWNRIHRRHISDEDDRLAYRPEITGINSEMDPTTTPNRTAFDIQVEITQTNRYCSSLT
ncbi:hypothetical protein ALC60_09281 [Trachymyrmex zeteki]|uniref:Uncharacterized protein n=1 Tax=Mycetomoellerius zeteki TaxID=64791 RepID=A0A151WUV2_9HYME|nr:hypothetical protein ALC60_09281 [Trachymyrmex zeteki]